MRRTCRAAARPAPYTCTQPLSAFLRQRCTEADTTSQTPAKVESAGKAQPWGHLKPLVSPCLSSAAYIAALQAASSFGRHSGLMTSACTCAAGSQALAASQQRWQNSPQQMQSTAGRGLSLQSLQRTCLPWPRMTPSTAFQMAVLPLPGCPQSMATRDCSVVALSISRLRLSHVQ